jgi:uncharacterized protein (TIGR00730 family)
MKKIAVFCGSSAGNKAVYAQAAQKLADVLCLNNLTLVYGGARVGLMGILANRMLEKNAAVTGVMPQFLVDKEVAHSGLTELIKVDSMHERKAMIQEMADGFIALPGGFGTIEEIFEMITWSQLNLHSKPCAFFNVNSYYNYIDLFLENCVKEGFIARDYKEMIIIENDPEMIISRFASYQHHTIDKAFLARNNLT